MPTTTYKGLEVQTTGTNSGTWGSTLNASTIEVIDRNCGGIVSKTLSSSNVTLSATESQNLIVRLTGTLTANVQVSTAAQGFHIVENLTSGSFTVTFTDGVASVEIPQGSRCLVAMDATNGARRISGEFASGTEMVFRQTTAPVGWTKSTNYHNHALRVTTGTISAGGTNDFDTCFTSRTPTGTVGSTTLTIAQIPAHTHGYDGLIASGSHPTGTGGVEARGSVTSQNSASSGGGGSHTHSWTGDAMNFSVKWTDVIFAVKN